MNTRILMAMSLVLASLVFVPAASAEGPCDNAPDKQTMAACQSATRPLDNEGCNGGDKGGESCGANQCPQEPADPRTGAPRERGCSETVCKTPDWNITPEGGEDCLDMICRNVPPVIERVKFEIAPIVTLLGTIPGTTIVRSIVVNAGFYCERGYGDSGPGSPCRRVLWTPVGSVGAEPDAVVKPSGETATECSWAQSGVGGYNYVGDRGVEWTLVDGECDVNVRATVVLGSTAEHYRFTDSCA